MRKTILLASTLAIAACGGRDFDQPYRIAAPRILAVKADPPQPSFATPTTLSTLLYEPPLDRVADKCPNPGVTTYSWSWCPWPLSSNTNYQCPIGDAEFGQFYAAMNLGPAPSLDLGHGQTATFTNPFPAPLLYALCRGDIGTSLGGTGAPSGTPSSVAGQSVFNCVLPAEDTNVDNKLETHPIGFKVSVKVEITPACPGLLPTGFSPLVAVYSLYLPTNEAVPANQNPVLEGIWVTSHGYADPDASFGGPDSGDPLPDSGDGQALDGGAFDGGVPQGAGLDGGEVDGGVAAYDAGAPPPAGTEPALRQGPDGSVPLDDEARIFVKRNKHVGIQLNIGIEQAEHLAVPRTVDYDSSRDLTRHYEHLDFAWYVEAGSFSARGKGETTGYLPTLMPPGQDNPPSAEDYENFEFNTTNEWDVPKSEDYAHRTARIIVVVRDGRGGVDWTSKLVTLEDLP